MDPRRLLPYLLAVTVCAVVATTALVLVSQRDSAQTSATGPPAVAGTGPRAVLADWDARRSAAWAAGDAEALGDLYVDGSRTGRVDVRMLRAYADRGLRVEGLTTQVLALEVLEQSDDGLRLRVTDRVAGGVVLGAASRPSLPRDRASVRTLTLARVDGAWLMVTVRDQDSAAASTSRTSTSWKS